MATQSFLMMQMAGAGWQYGKRKISAMNNEEFNALTVNELLNKEVADVRSAIPTIIQSMDHMTDMVGPIVAQYGDFVREALRALPEAARNVFGGETQTNVAVSSGSGVKTKPGVASFISIIMAEVERLQSIEQSSVVVPDQPRSSDIPSKVTSDYNRERELNLLKLQAHATKQVFTKYPVGGRVSKQSLKLQRNVLQKDVAKKYTTLNNYLRAYDKCRSHFGSDKSKCRKMLRDYNSYIKVWKKSQQDLLDYLNRWKGKF